VVRRREGGRGDGGMAREQRERRAVRGVQWPNAAFPSYCAQHSLKLKKKKYNCLLIAIAKEGQRAH